MIRNPFNFQRGGNTWGNMVMLASGTSHLEVDKSNPPGKTNRIENLQLTEEIDQFFGRFI